MSTEQMRAKVKEAYRGEKWDKKVSKMSDKQIIAVYQNFLHSGRLK